MIVAQQHGAAPERALRTQAVRRLNKLLERRLSASMFEFICPRRAQPQTADSAVLLVQTRIESKRRQFGQGG